jgi:hypothetical protein
MPEVNSVSLNEIVPTGRFFFILLTRSIRPWISYNWGALGFIAPKEQGGQAPWIKNPQYQ